MPHPTEHTKICLKAMRGSSQTIRQLRRKVHIPVHFAIMVGTDGSEKEIGINTMFGCMFRRGKITTLCRERLLSAPFVGKNALERSKSRLYVFRSHR